MKSLYIGLTACLVSVLLCGLPAATSAGPERAHVHHDITVRIDPVSHSLTAEDVITFPEGVSALVTVRQGEAGARIPFQLHAGLEVECAADSAFTLSASDAAQEPKREGSGEEGADHAMRTREYALVIPLADAAPREGEPVSIHLKLSGTIHHPPVAEGEEYARSFSRTPGTIGEEGVFLSGASAWLPWFGDVLTTFRLTVDLPEGWDAVSQGERTSAETKDGRRHVTWVCAHPMDEVYLIANRFTEYARDAGSVKAYAFLRAPDPNLANKYLEVTAQYIEMYRKLIGPYPFTKFALIENFWETGYGMPSFTLLGPKVIRFPFILHSSYPHEILHNWWGNSVYVDWQTGNWCEGMTAYLADHLIREGQGRGTEYRLDTLKGYRNYVSEGKDFPLTQFRSRHSSATQAIGYGKCLMLCHMLRRKLGEDAFTAGLQQFYRAHTWHRASFADLREAFDTVTTADLRPFFEQWVERTGAPTLALSNVSASGRVVGFEIRQTQAGAPYDLEIPVAITLRGVAQAHVVDLRLQERTRAVILDVPGTPMRMDLDPEFDVFRRLDRTEIPPTLSEMFGAEKVTLILPQGASDAWRVFAKAWGGKTVRVVEEGALQALPTDGAVWVLGGGNAWKRVIIPLLEKHGAGLKPDRIDFGVVEVPRAEHSFVYVARHPDHPDLTVGWLGAPVAEALPGLARKLPHYGKYSYLAFQGAAPDNVAKGRWEALGSPLTVSLVEGGLVPRGTLPTRKPLARLAPVFDPTRLMKHVRWLADPAREGRGVGTKGLDASAEYIAAAMKAAGLQPAGDDGTWFQTFTAQNGPDGKAVTLRNVVGVLPGTNTAWKDQSVVLGAHYDHLGSGWPDARAAVKGEIYNGADDNASGVAVLLELAQILGKELKPKRSVVFAAFTGEEWGLKGSAHYVAHAERWPAAKAIAMVNMDTVGRLAGKKIQVLGAGTATEWRHIAMGVGFTTGVESTCIADDPGGSDQQSFVKVGVPGVQIFTGVHGDYHRPTDDVEKVDAGGLVKVATFVRETIVYLSGRAEPLTSTLKTAGAHPGKRPVKRPGERRVSFGSMPDFAFRGPGVRVKGVVSGSPAEAAGIQAGDILLAIDDDPLKDLRGFGQVLRTHAPGDVVKVRLRRGSEEMTVEAKLVAR